MAHATVGTYALNPEFPTTIEVLRRGARSPIDSGMLQRRQTLSSEFAAGQAARRTFTLVYRNATLENYHELVALWDASAGGCEVLSWTSRGNAYSGTDETLSVRMTSAPLSLKSTGPKSYAFEVSLEEVSHLP